MQWKVPSKPLAVDDPLLLPEREVHAEIGTNWEAKGSQCAGKRGGDRATSNAQ